MQGADSHTQNPISPEAEADLASRLLECAYHLAGGDTHKPVDLLDAGDSLGLSDAQTRLLLSRLVEEKYVLSKEEPGRIGIYLTPKAIKQMASIQTRR